MKRFLLGGAGFLAWSPWALSANLVHTPSPRSQAFSFETGVSVGIGGTLGGGSQRTLDKTQKFFMTTSALASDDGQQTLLPGTESYLQTDGLKGMNGYALNLNGGFDWFSSRQTYMHLGYDLYIGSLSQQNRYETFQEDYAREGFGNLNYRTSQGVSLGTPFTLDILCKVGGRVHHGVPYVAFGYGLSYAKASYEASFAASSGEGVEHNHILRKNFWIPSAVAGCGFKFPISKQATLDFSSKLFWGLETTLPPLSYAEPMLTESQGQDEPDQEKGTIGFHSSESTIQVTQVLTTLTLQYQYPVR